MMIPLILTGISLEYDNVIYMKTRAFLQAKSHFDMQIQHELSRFFIWIVYRLSTSASA